MMQETIENFSAQFAFEPEMKNAKSFVKFKHFVVMGMGGSHLAADLVKIWDPLIPLTVHRNYGLPHIPRHALKNTLFIASSYSGNTEETIDAFKEAMALGMKVAAITTGGKILDLAKKHGITFVKLPEMGLQPRMATGVSLKALVKIMGLKKAYAEIGKLAYALETRSEEERGKELASRLKDYVPIIYSSEKNYPIAANWKIKFNETGKIPAFCNALPEANHNEMTGFDAKKNTRKLARNFHFIFLKDSADHPRTQKRFEALYQIYQKIGLPVTEIDMPEAPIFQKIFRALILGDWVAYHTALNYGVEANEVPLVEEFKKLIS